MTTDQHQQKTDGTHMWLVLWKTYDVLHKHAMQSISTLQMCVTDFGILELLLHKGPNTINVIGEKLSLASGSVTAAIDRLEKRALVQRVPSSTDRRAKHVELTPDGRILIESAFEEHSSHMNLATNGLSEEEIDQLTVLLKKLGHSAQARLDVNSGKF
jgi:MarR family transcriptional regulator, 2-MHQ and catechol-resistance regulon repressor